MSGNDENEVDNNENEVQFSVYVMPSVPGMPPRAVLHPVEPVAVIEGTPVIPGVIVTWSADLGCWTDGMTPVPSDIGEVITEHAKSLGVEGWS